MASKSLSPIERVKFLPTRPAVMLEYDRLKTEGRFVKDSFWSQPEVRSYLDEKWKVIGFNLANKGWLKENKKEFANQDEIQSRIDEFEDWEDENSHDLQHYYSKTPPRL